MPKTEKFTGFGIHFFDVKVASSRKLEQSQQNPSPWSLNEAHNNNRYLTRLLNDIYKEVTQDAYNK